VPEGNEPVAKPPSKLILMPAPFDGPGRAALPILERNQPFAGNLLGGSGHRTCRFSFSPLFNPQGVRRVAMTGTSILLHFAAHGGTRSVSNCAHATSTARSDTNSIAIACASREHRVTHSDYFLFPLHSLSRCLTGGVERAPKRAQRGTTHWAGVRARLGCSTTGPVAHTGHFSSFHAISQNIHS
jgi:hypothetical protein